MKAAKYTFVTFSLLFQPLYFLMLWMYVEELKVEENELARVLDMGIIVLGVVFMGMQAFMLALVAKPHKAQLLKRLFYVGLVVWFFLEVVLSYWWCFVTGADPLWEHTPFVLLFLGFIAAQHWALKRLGVLGQEALSLETTD